MVHDIVDVPLPLEEIERQVTRSADMGVWADLAFRRGELMVVGPSAPGGARRSIEFDVAEPIHGTDRTIFPIAWRAAGSSWLFPHMDAELVLEALSLDVTRITFRGRYRPPLDRVGAMLDRLALHRVAKATVRNFLEQLVEALTSTAGSDAPGPGDSDDQLN